jgi:hypothetical protein
MAQQTPHFSKFLVDTLETFNSLAVSFSGRA